MKITPVKPKNTVVMKTSDAKAQKTVHQWWKAKNQTERAKQLVDTAAYLKESQNSRFKQAAIYVSPRIVQPRCSSPTTATTRSATLLRSLTISF
jgi:hypothetical protein